MRRNEYQDGKLKQEMSNSNPTIENKITLASINSLPNKYNIQLDNHNDLDMDGIQHQLSHFRNDYNMDQTRMSNDFDGISVASTLPRRNVNILDSKVAKLNHIITDTLPGPESCV